MRVRGTHHTRAQSSIVFKSEAMHRKASARTHRMHAVYRTIDRLAILNEELRDGARDEQRGMQSLTFCLRPSGATPE
jgi:hypothetical protein